MRPPYQYGPYHHPGAPYAQHRPRRPTMPGQVVAAAAMMGGGAFRGPGFTLMYGVAALVAALDAGAAQGFLDDVTGAATPGAPVVHTAVFALLEPACTVASTTMAVRAGRPTQSTPRAVALVQALAFPSLPLSGWTLLAGDSSTVTATGVMGLYCAVVALLVLTGSARACYPS